VQRESLREREVLTKCEAELLNASTALKKASALSRRTEQQLQELSESLKKRLAQRREVEDGQSQSHQALLRSLEESFRGFSERARVLKMDPKIIGQLQQIEASLREGHCGL
jgi:hypothetical protein